MISLNQDFHKNAFQFAKVKLKAITTMVLNKSEPTIPEIKVQDNEDEWCKLALLWPTLW